MTTPDQTTTLQYGSMIAKSLGLEELEQSGINGNCVMINLHPNWRLE